MGLTEYEFTQGGVNLPTDLHLWIFANQIQLPSAENIIGIGVDIVEVARIQEAVDKHPIYKHRVYTPEEIQYCDDVEGNLRAQRYSARYAGKEAVAKAIGGMPYRFLDVCILNNEEGKPEVELRERAREYAESKDIQTVFISLSHLRETAAAFAIALRANRA